MIFYHIKSVCLTFHCIKTAVFNSEQKAYKKNMTGHDDMILVLHLFSYISYFIDY